MDLREHAGCPWRTVQGRASMRITALAIGAVSVGVVIAVAWRFRPASEVSDARTSVAVPATAPAHVAVDTRTRPDVSADASVETPAPATKPVAGTSVPQRTLVAAPLPGQTPVTPMAELIEARKEKVPPGLVQNERAFSAERVDAAWAPGAEADILARFAQMSGLALTGLQIECRSTMCRLQVASPISPDPARPPFNILINSIGLEPRWAISVVDEAGTLQSVAYLWRMGMASERGSQ